VAPGAFPPPAAIPSFSFQRNLCPHRSFLIAARQSILFPLSLERLLSHNAFVHISIIPAPPPSTLPAHPRWQSISGRHSFAGNSHHDDQPSQNPFHAILTPFVSVSRKLRRCFPCAAKVIFVKLRSRVQFDSR